MWVRLDEDGRVCVTSDVKEYADLLDDSGEVVSESVEMELPEGFDAGRQGDFRLVDGELVDDPAPEPPEEESERLRAELASTDYVPVKLAEMMVCGEELPEEDADRYAGIILRRREIRARISELEVVTEDGASAQGQ